ncbi:uncharacterized protein LOC121718612 isoform X2 [Alosa sapidissima]|uniref:uncharacterized protein LOC121718612 isoform X2 n=1 Tax=Alosa sapidissima TaxID=34773 RepID=UPI001C09F6B5|nr:uncharacterized protein LOC121718612 isoform X2 [Alosa sapidissima]XP_041959621.1 uncharacterized protein LOC121718612 isoform X2 [Alosa sapidissima]
MNYLADSLLLFSIGRTKQLPSENEVDGLTLTKMTERMSERMFPKMKDQVQFMAALDKLKLGDSHDAEVRAETPVMPVSPVSPVSFDVILPPFLNSALSSQDPQFKSQGKNKLKNALIQALFDHLSQKTMYPSHTQYVLTLRSTLIRFPFLREKYGSGYDALLESLRNKFKKERRPLVNLEEVFKMKEKYSALLGEMKRIYQIDADKTILTKMGELAPKLLEKAPKGTLKDTCLQTLQSCEDEQERKAQMVNAAIVLLPSFFKENPAFLFVNDQEPISPTPTIVMTGSNPLSSTEVAVKMDGCNMILDDGSIDVSLALAVSFSLFHVYQVHYPKPLRKTLAFLEAFVFQMKSAVPLTVQKLFNSLH